ncbi:MAG: ATP-binding protein [Paracoccaceae bacterium]
MVVASAASVAVTYKLAGGDLNARVQRLGEEHVSHLQNELWQLDLETVQAQLDSYVELGMIVEAAVTDATGLRLAAGHAAPDHNPIVKSFPLVHVQREGLLNIGTLTLTASRQSIYELARTRVMALFIIAGLALLIGSLLIFRQFNQNVLTPIHKIADELRSRPKDWQAFNIDLARFAHADELDELVESIHEMRDQILASQAEILVGQSRQAQAAKLAGLGYSTSDQNRGRFIECDETYAALHGKTVAEMMDMDVETDLIQRLYHEDEIEQAEELKQRLMLGESLEQTNRIVLENDEVRYIHKIFQAKADAEVGIVDIVAQDLTELYTMRESLLQAQKMQAIGKLTGGVAHDFNNILAVISGNLELLRDNPKHAVRDGYVLAALEAVRRGATVTQRLLAFARKQPLAPAVIDVSRLLRESAALLRTSAGAAINLEIVNAGGLWRTLVDPAQLEAVVLNLVVNARDAMPEGGKLTIETSNASLDRSYAARHSEVVPGQYVCLSVTDSGEGMQPEVVRQAMEPFFTTKEVGKGTGLGLSMAFGFAKQSGGHMNIYSEVGVGTTVKLYLPRVDAEAITEPSEETPEKARKLENLKIFVVEDEDGLRETITTQIRSLGCEVHAAADGASALKLAKTLPQIDILLSDVVLPGAMDGSQVAKKLGAMFPDCAIIFMSGFAANSAIHNGMLHHADVVLQKPFSLSDLTIAFESSISRKRS